VTLEEHRLGKPRFLDDIKMDLREVSCEDQMWMAMVSSRALV
jgi:hypothetical protein